MVRRMPKLPIAVIYMMALEDIPTASLMYITRDALSQFIQQIQAVPSATKPRKALSFSGTL